MRSPKAKRNTFQVNKDLFNELGIRKSTSCHECKAKGSYGKSGKLQRVLPNSLSVSSVVPRCDPQVATLAIELHGHGAEKHA